MTSSTGGPSQRSISPGAARRTPATSGLGPSSRSPSRRGWDRTGSAALPRRRRVTRIANSSSRSGEQRGTPFSFCRPIGRNGFGFAGPGQAPSCSPATQRWSKKSPEASSRPSTCTGAPSVSGWNMRPPAMRPRAATASPRAIAPPVRPVAAKSDSSPLQASNTWNSRLSRGRSPGQPKASSSEEKWRLHSSAVRGGAAAPYAASHPRRSRSSTAHPARPHSVGRLEPAIRKLPRRRRPRSNAARAPRSRSAPARYGVSSIRLMSLHALSPGVSPRRSSALRTRGHAESGRPADRLNDDGRASPSTRAAGSRTPRKMRSTRSRRSARPLTTTPIRPAAPLSSSARAQRAAASISRSGSGKGTSRAPAPVSGGSAALWVTVQPAAASASRNSSCCGG